MSEWIRQLLELRRERRPAVLVTVASVKGSTPREPGAKMIVTDDGLFGTIGGGHLELKAIDIARSMLASGGACSVQRFPLGAALGQCCGGLVNLLFEPVATEATWPETLCALAQSGTDCVLVAAANGAASADKLIFTAGDCFGSLGDDALDGRAREIARAMLAEGGEATLMTLATGEPCARDPLFFFEPVRAVDFHVVLFGAGHVGKALVRVLEGLPCRITWVDPREEQFPRETPANVSVACTDIPEAEVDAAPAGSYFLVMTHSHALDQELVERILQRGDFAYLGLIGSVSKRRQFEKRMAHKGIDPACFAAMTCPIGVPGITGKQPAAIAIAVAAELLQVRERLAAAVGNSAKARRA